jgi:ribosome-associated translation inhibitor RaiA
MVREKGGRLPRAAKRAPFAKKVPRSRKVLAGRAPAAGTPLAVRTAGVDASKDFKQRVREKMGLRLGKFARHIERVTVRFEDVNGPRGGVDSLCRVKVVMSGVPSVVVEETAADPMRAFDRASQRAERAVRSGLERARTSGRIRRLPVSSGRAVRGRAGSGRVNPPPAKGSLVGRRVGRSAANLEKAAARPEKERRDYYVDTSLPGVSASDRRAGGGSTARRNTLKRTRRATATLEDSATGRPSRKSTRKSASRAKQGGKLVRRQTQRVTSSKARARRSAAKAR